jgi:Kef-type K+ transport system membrane component KefB
MPGALLVLLLIPAAAAAAGEAHGPDVMPILEALVVMLLGARLGGSLAERVGQPAVLGELAAGIAIGNLGLAGVHGLEGLAGLDAIQVFAQIGVLFLLFRVGLESNVGQMMRVGASSLLVATLGVVAPMLLGLGVSRWFFPAHHPLTHWFVGATLCATSVGITARVLADLKRAASVEGRIILGAAVIDDVMGLIVLAVISGVISAAGQGQAFQPWSVLWIFGKALIFLVGAVVLGGWLSPRVFRLAGYLRGERLLLPIALAMCFGLAWVAGRVGLAPIVGAFAGGLILEEAHYADLLERDPERRRIPQLLEPLETFLVPIFFVLMGMRVDLRVFGSPAILAFAAVLTLAAVAGKQVCAFGVLEKGADRLAVGLGMIPRGEVGLIFASIGATLLIGGERVVDDTVFSAVVIMVAVTTLVTPPLLAWRLRSGAPTPAVPLAARAAPDRGAR